MTEEELNQAKDLLAQAAEHAAVKILQGEGNKIVVQVSHFFKNKPADNWTMTLERAEE